MRIFDYAFYSLYSLYLRTEKKENNNVNSAIYAILGLKSSLVLGLVILSSLFYKGSISQYIGIDKNILNFIFLAIWFIWGIAEYKLYKNRLPQIVKKYTNHPRNKWFKAWMLYFIALGFILIPILIVKILKAFS